jgi:hypothetical protein
VCGRDKSATAARDKVTVILAPVGSNGFPTVAIAGNVAVTCALTGCGPEGNPQA